MCVRLGFFFFYLPGEVRLLAAMLGSFGIFLDRSFLSCLSAVVLIVVAAYLTLLILTSENFPVIGANDDLLSRLYSCGFYVC